MRQYFLFCFVLLRRRYLPWLGLKKTSEVDSANASGTQSTDTSAEKVFPISPGNSAYHLAQSHNGRKKRHKKIKIVVWPENKAKRSCVCQILLQEVEKKRGGKGGGKG